MVEVLWKLLALLIGIAMISLFTAMLKVAFEGDRLFMALSAVFFVTLLGVVLIIDGRERRSGRAL